MDVRRHKDLRILILDPPHSKAQTFEHSLKNRNFACVTRHVHARKQTRQCLENFAPHAVLADISIPRYRHHAILDDIRGSHPEIPLIFTGGALSATEAITLLHQGASDYVPVSELDKLPQSILNALKREHKIRERKAAERALRETMEKLKLFRTLIDQSTDGIEIVDPATMRFLDVNDAECRSLGYRKEEMLQMTVMDIDPVARLDNADKVNRVLGELGKAGVARFESIHQRKDGSEFPVEVSVQLIELEKAYSISIARDISERKKHESEMLRLNHVLRTLNEANSTLLHTDDETELMTSICSMLVGRGDYSLAWIGMARNDDGRSIQPVAIAGDGEDYVNELRLSWGQGPRANGPCGLAVRTGETQNVGDTSNDPRFSPWRELAGRFGYASCAALPLKNKHQTLGCLTIYSRDPFAFSNDEIGLLEEVAGNLAFGILNLRVRAERDQAILERENYTERLRESMVDAIQAVATVVEMRDLYTAGHQRRVAELAFAIARELGMSDECANGVYLAGIVHDIGKIHIPAEILSKPAKLTPPEYEMVKTHSQTGYDILKGIEFPWPIAQAVLQHHERMDGSGYPQGLKGEDILIEARILAVADVIESMSSHRPYRAGLGMKPAFAEIRKNRGILYDARVANACLKLFREKRFTFSK